MSFSLFNQLPAEQKKKLFEQQKKEGLIFHVFSKIAGKNKFIVIVETSKDGFLMGHVLINSTINKKIARTIEHQNLHLKISSSDYPFLNQDSYINCQGLFDIPYTKIEAIFINKTTNYKGCLTAQDLGILQYMIKKSPTIINKQKKQYGYL